MRAVMTIAAAIIASAALAWEAPLPRVSGVEVSGGGSVVESGVNPGYAANADKALMVDTYDPSSASRPGIAADAMLTRDMVRQYRRSDEKVNWGDVTNHADYVTAAVTNGLATTNFVYAQNYVTASVTNGLAATNFVYTLATNRYTKAETDAKDAATLQAAKDYTDQHGGGGAVQSVNGKTGVVVLDAAAIPYSGSESYEQVADVEKGLDYAIQTADYAMAEATGRPTYDELNVKADRAASGHADEIAALDADGNPKASGKKASDFAPAIEGGYLGMVNSWVYFDEYNNTMLWGRLRFSGTTKEIFNSGQYLVYSDFALVGQEREIAVKEDIASATADLAPKTMIAATDPTFSNAVLAVGLNIDTNSVAVLNEIAATFGGFPIAGTTTTVGGLLAALAAAVAWLKKRAAHLDDDGLADDTFATDLLGKPITKGAITASLADPFVAKTSGSYAEGDPVTYDGKLYKRSTEPGDDTSWVSSHWMETTVATLWNNADTTSYGGQN